MVVEEIKMVEDTPDDLVHEIFTQGFWEDHPLGRPILGTRETVESFTADIAADLFQGRLHAAEPHRGGGRQSRTRSRQRDLVAETFRTPEAGRCRAARGAAAGHPENPDSEQGARAEPRLSWAPTAIRQDHEDRYASYVLNTLLGGSMSSRLFQNVREKRGLAYAVFCGLSAYRDAGSFTIYAGCANEAVGEVVDLVVEELQDREVEPGASGRAPAREGSPEGQPDAQPREHGQPDVARRAAGDLLRTAVRPRRNARRASNA